MREKTFRNWSVTCNNYTEQNILDFKNFGKSKNQCVFGFEKGEGGTPHIQGALIINNKISASALRKKLPGFHCEIKFKKSTCKQLFSYCLKGTSEKKDGWYYENTGPNYSGWHFGDFPTNQGERTDIDDMKECKTMRDAFETGHNTQCIQYFKEYIKYYEQPRRLKPTCYWYFGSTGRGKSRLARLIANYWGKYYVKSDASKWWDGYDGEQIIIIDDYDPKSWAISYNDLLHICDRYEHRVETKGGSRQFKGLRIFITTQLEVRHTFFSEEVGCIKQLERRVEQISFNQKFS